MRILCVDIGTGTQDIFLYDSRLDLENGFKIVAPAPTMMVHRRLKEATRAGRPILLTGLTMGGGPSQWAVEAHIEAGYQVFATPDAARSFNDDLEVIRDMGVKVIGEDETGRLPAGLVHLEMRDFDFPSIARAFAEFGVSLDDLAAVAVAVFDHGAAPPGYSDRQFRFDYIMDRLSQNDHLSAFAFPAGDVPAIMTRLSAVVQSAAGVDAPLVLMDTAPAAILGATLDPNVRNRGQALVTNIGNFHTLAFRLRGTAVEGVFEHHTGMLDRPKLDRLLRALADGTLTHEEIFHDHGHGAYIANPNPQNATGITDEENLAGRGHGDYIANRDGQAVGPDPLDVEESDFGLVVTGPRRAMMADSTLRPYFATPYGDMMLTGCFGLLAATAEVLPDLTGPIQASLQSAGPAGAPPWEL